MKRKIPLITSDTIGVLALLAILIEPAAPLMAWIDILFGFGADSGPQFLPDARYKPAERSRDKLRSWI